MSKKVLFGLLVAVVAGCIGLFFQHQRVSAAAFPCNAPNEFGTTSCYGYFSGANGVPSITGTGGDNLLNVFPAPALNNVTGPGSFESIISGYLNSGNYQSRIGAAFIIDTMLGHTTFKSSGGVNAGVNYAKNNFGTWQNLVNHYAAGGPGYGVNWSSMPDYNTFCGQVNSAYAPTISDDVFHMTICPYGYTFGTPVITFYWNNGGSKFIIGRGCGNVESSLSTIPIDRNPSGTITLSCDTTTWTEYATVTVSDPDASTNGYIKTGSWQSGTVASGGSHRIDIPRSATNPYGPQGVALWVKDTGTVGTQQYVNVANANTPNSCVSLGCGGMTVTPARLDPYTKFSVQVSVTNSVGQTPPGATMSLTITPPSGATYSYSGSQAAGGSGGTSTATFSNLGPTGKAGVYTVTWKLTAANVTITCPGATGGPITFSVVDLPYLQVYGGDVEAGGGPAYACAGSTAPTNPNAGVYSWNNHTTDFSGAGTQYAVQALAQIEDFASAQNSNSPVPAGLSFANTTAVDTAGGLFGGDMGAVSADCDFTSGITTAPVQTDTLIPGTTVATNSHVVQYVKGADVYINGNITYQGTGGWSSPASIPSYRLVVIGGNIYVGAGVTQLDGLYVAAADGGTGGRIYTCSYLQGAQYKPYTPTTANYYTDCNKQLLVNGAFAATQVQFLRTYGSVGQAKTTDTTPGSSHAAEVFNYTPELWLPRGAAQPSGGYAAITGLPPVL